jgi:hypothetical protein
MDLNQREEYLKRLANSNEGEALKEYLGELIGKLTDARNFGGENFEIEGKASIKAVAILEKIMRDLSLLKKRSKKKNVKNEYI